MGPLGTCGLGTSGVQFWVSRCFKQAKVSFACLKVRRRRLVCKDMQGSQRGIQITPVGGAFWGHKSVVFL